MRKAVVPKAVRKAVVRRAVEVRKAAPSMCAQVVASVAWPAGWRTECAGPRDAVLGLTNPQSRTTTVYVRAGESLATMHVVVLHEAGHAWDIARLDSPKIVEWCATRGCDPSRFFSGGRSGAGWGQPGGAEDWAAVWDACHGGDYHRSYLGLGAPSLSDCALQNALVGYAA